MISITKLISILDKPNLVNWANKIGLDGISLSEYRNKSTAKGTNRHKEIEDFINTGKEFDGFEKLQQTLKDFKIIGCEVSVKNEFLNGRVDLIISKNGEEYVCDFKKGKGIYLSTKLQLSSYKHLYGADKIAFINTEDLELIVLNINTNKYYEIIKRLYQINKLLTELNEKL